MSADLPCNRPGDANPMLFLPPLDCNKKTLICLKILTNTNKCFIRRFRKSINYVTFFNNCVTHISYFF